MYNIKYFWSVFFRKVVRFGHYRCKNAYFEKYIHAFSSKFQEGIIHVVRKQNFPKT